MNIDLTPTGRPSAFSGSCAQPGEALFDPVLFDGGSKIIAGGPRLLGIFDAKGGKPLWELSSKTEHGIAGFCLFEGSIYVQDGPVLSAWHGQEQRLFAARNLSTGITWAKEDGPFNRDFYDYSDDDTDSAAQLLTAQRRHAWASLLADLAPSQDGHAGTLSLTIRAQLGFSGQDASQIKGDAEASLRSVKQAAAKIVFSAPVTRRHRRAGAGGNIIFTLGMNGSVYAMDALLDQVAQVTRGADLPLRPHLVIAEPPADSGGHLCHLYYLTASGGITVLNGVSSDLNQLTGWTGVGAPDSRKVLPLSYHDGVLMGGGILRADFLVADSMQPGKLLHQVAAPDGAGWTSYQPDTHNKLVVLSNGRAARLFAYGDRAVVRDRWGLRQSAAPIHLAITQVAAKAKPTPWLIETDVGAAGAEQPRWRALYVNVVDTPKNNPLYRPPSVELASGSLKAHTLGTPVNYGWIRSTPLVNETDIFCVVREQAARLLQSGAGDAATSLAYDLYALQQQLDGAAPSGLLRASGELAAPVAGTVCDALVNFDLKTRTPELQKAAEAEYKNMQLRAEPVAGAIIQISVSKDVGIGINPIQHMYGPEPLANTTLILEIQPGGEQLTVTTDNHGVLYVNRSHLGATVSISKASLQNIRLRSLLPLKIDYIDCESFKVSDGKPATLVISCITKSNSLFPHRG